MKVAVIQVQANNLSEHRQAWERLENMVQEAAKSHDLVLVPECAYPAYFIHPEEGDVHQIVSEGELLLSRMKTIARQHEAYIAYGYVEKEENNLYNSALLIDRNGNEVVKKRKSFLWHFDNLWFTEGHDLAVTETEFGKVALVVCADARMPEIVRMAALEGAKLIIDLANLTSTGADISTLQNAQSEYMLSVRALENKVWLAVSNKWGVEADSITYCGRSSVYAPDGSCVNQASTDSNEIISVDIPTDEQGKIICPDVISPITRRPELYEPLTKDTQSLPITKILNQPVVPATVTPYVATASGNFQSADQYLQMIRRLIQQGSGIICMPAVSFSISGMIESIAALLPDGVVTAATELEGQERMTTHMITSNGIEFTYRTLHSEDAKESMDYPLFGTQWGIIGIMHDKEALLPEWPRTLMLLGADCLLWPNQLPQSISSKVSRTRAAENRIYVVSAHSGDNGISQIIDPNGSVVASTLQNRTIHACGTQALFTTSRIKTIVPGTNVVANRRPKFYGGIMQ